MNGNGRVCGICACDSRRCAVWNLNSNVFISRSHLAICISIHGFDLAFGLFASAGLLVGVRRLFIVASLLLVVVVETLQPLDRALRPSRATHEPESFRCAHLTIKRGAPCAEQRA